MIRRPKRSSTTNKVKLESQELLIRENTATLYGIYFATSNTDFLLEEKKTRFSVRPNVILNADRVTTIFDYSGIIGSNQEAIFDGFFRGLSAGATLALDGGTESTASYINEMNGTPLTNFADTYTIKTIDVEKKILVAEKSSAVSSTTAVSFNGNYFIDLPQFTKTASNQDSKSVNKIINLLSNQSLTHIGVRVGSILEFKKTTSNNKRYTVKGIRRENGFEVVDVDEPITKEDATQTQIILSVYVTEKQNQERIARTSQPIMFTTAQEGGCTGPDGKDKPKGFGPEFQRWLQDDLKCCKCLVYAEGECSNDKCQQCTAWAIYNRRKDPVPGGAVPPYNHRDEDSYCDQSTMPGRFAGGWGAPKFNSCWCNTSTNPLSLECIEKADLICKRIGHSNYGNLPDPTGGANYFWTCGKVPAYMACNVQAGICEKVTTGDCKDCGNCFYKCTGVPQLCSDLGIPQADISDLDPNPPVQSA